MNEIEFINNEIARYFEALNKVKIDEPKTIKIDSVFISKRKDKPTEASEESLKAKVELEKFKNKPVLYWFSFENDLAQQIEIHQHFKQFCEEKCKLEYKTGKDHYYDNELNYRRAFSALKKKKDNDFKTKTLYVGKVEKDIWGRLAVHLGWGTSPKTAGMQLRFWYDFEKYGNLTFNYIDLNNDLKYFVEVLEKELRKELNPLLGKK